MRLLHALALLVLVHTSQFRSPREVGENTVLARYNFS